MKRRILVADDHVSARKAVGELIRTLGDDWVLACEADDGQAAVKLAAEAKPDLVILDVRMPNLDGVRAGCEIRKFLPEVPILLYSLFGSPQLDVQARKAGFQGAVAKPDGAALLAAIREIFDSQRPDEGAPNPAEQVH